MRAALAVLRVCASAACALSLACARPAQGPLAGASDALAKPAEVERPPPPPAPTWAAYAAARQWPAANTSPFTSRGHMPAQQVDVRVSPECRASYLALVTDSVLPEGCVLAELSQVGASGGYGMQKVAGAWSFFELDPHGGVLASGTLALCGGCHAQASADGVFGLPREPATAR